MLQVGLPVEDLKPNDIPPRKPGRALIGPPHGTSDRNCRVHAFGFLPVAQLRAVVAVPSLQQERVRMTQALQRLAHMIDGLRLAGHRQGHMPHAERADIGRRRHTTEDHRASFRPLLRPDHHVVSVDDFAFVLRSTFAC